ncbi:MAG: phosphoribosyltransferase domain-containing protein [Desulfamplus sp.]|nr:phosphoribosyltransferase domain-containing protein [Desulfamplus sp.]
MFKDFYHLKRENNPHREDAFTLSCLGKIYPASSSDFVKFRGYLSSLIDEAHSLKDDRILIIGLTESGIIPALLMYIEAISQNINTSILYSTRRPSAGIPFKESHSHGPNHILPLLTFNQTSSLEHNVFKEDFKFQEIWIVEDEITSGNTVYNLMTQLSQYLQVSRMRVFAFADFRDSQQKSDFHVKTALNNIECTIHTLNLIDNFAIDTPNINLPSIETKKNNSNGISFNNNIAFNSNLKKLNAPDRGTFQNWYFPEKRPALSIKSGNFIDDNLWQTLSNHFSNEWVESKNTLIKTVLAVGEAVDLAACLALTNENIRFQQISLSPWKVDNRSIFSKITIADKYYLYNYENLKAHSSEPIFILCDPIDKKIEQEAIKKLVERGIDAKPIFQ